MASYLITGCSRGLGFAMAEHLVTLPSSEVDRVFATARHQSPALKALVESSAGRLTFVELDATKEQSITAAVAEVEFVLDGAGLDVLINNAGKMRTTPEGIINMCVYTKLSGMAYANQHREDLDGHLTTNVLSVHLVTRKFLPLLQKGELKKVANMYVSPTFSQTPLIRSQLHGNGLHLPRLRLQIHARPRLQSLQSSPQRPYRPILHRFRRMRLHFPRYHSWCTYSSSSQRRECPDVG